MRSFTAPVLAALASGNVVRVQALNLAFTSGVISLNSSTWDLVWAGITYKGAYGLGSISAIKDGPGEIQGISLELNGGDPLRIALALDPTDEVQGAATTVRTLLLDNSTYAVLDSPVDWLGKCDTMAIGEDKGSASIKVTVESAGVELLRSNVATYSDADQQAAYPGDRAFEYVVSQTDKPVIWPTREYYFK